MISNRKHKYTMEGLREITPKEWTKKTVLFADVPFWDYANSLTRQLKEKGFSIKKPRLHVSPLKQAFACVIAVNGTGLTPQGFRSYIGLQVHSDGHHRPAWYAGLVELATGRGMVFAKWKSKRRLGAYDVDEIVHEQIDQWVQEMTEHEPAKLIRRMKERRLETRLPDLFVKLGDSEAIAWSYLGCFRRLWKKIDPEEKNVLELVLTMGKAAAPMPATRQLESRYQIFQICTENL